MATPSTATAQRTSSSLYYSDDDEKDKATASAAKAAASPKTPQTSSYFSKLGPGRRLNGKPLSSASPKAEASSADTASTATETKPRMTSVVQGNWRYFYQVDPKTRQRKLVKREPVSSGSKLSTGRGHSLQ